MTAKNILMMQQKFESHETIELRKKNIRFSFLYQNKTKRTKTKILYIFFRDTEKNKNMGLCFW